MTRSSLTVAKNVQKRQMRLRKYTLLSGLAQMLFCCLQGVSIDSMPNRAIAKSAHHQFSHNGELLIALAFAFPVCELGPRMLWIAFALLQVGAWSNGLSYLVIAVSNCPQPMFSNSPG